MLIDVVLEQREQYKDWHSVSTGGRETKNAAPKERRVELVRDGCAGRTRTYNLRVMSRIRDRLAHRLTELVDVEGSPAGQRQWRHASGRVAVAKVLPLVVTETIPPVAELRPARGRRWVGGSALAAVWHGPAPQGLDQDLGRFDATIKDPSA